MELENGKPTFPTAISCEQLEIVNRFQLHTLTVNYSESSCLSTFIFCKIHYERSNVWIFFYCGLCNVPKCHTELSILERLSFLHQITPYKAFPPV